MNYNGYSIDSVIMAQRIALSKQVIFLAILVPFLGIVLSYADFQD